jgi:hypothetical protein
LVFQHFPSTQSIYTPRPIVPAVLTQY